MTEIIPGEKPRGKYEPRAPKVLELRDDWGWIYYKNGHKAGLIDIELLVVKPCTGETLPDGTLTDKTFDLDNGQILTVTATVSDGEPLEP